MAYAIARMAKQKGGSVGSSSLHNGRGRDTPNADPEREKDNRVLIGDERPVPERVREIIHEHGGKYRFDSVEAVEVLLTASPEWWRDDNDAIDLKKVDQFSKRALMFLSKGENGGILVKATLHMDEHSPHIHAIMVPIDPKGRLNCRHYFGSRADLAKWQDRFAAEVKDLGLERGQEGSRARHEKIKDFYKAIEREHRYQIDLKKLPDPPRVSVTKDAAEKFKQEFARELIKQIEEPIRTQLHQAMQTRDLRNKQKETQKRLAETKTQLVEEKLKVVSLQEEKTRLEERYYSAEKGRQTAEQRVQDVDRHSVMKMMGYRGVPADKRGSFHYIDPQQTQVLTLRPNGSVYDSSGQVLAHNSLDLVRELLHRQGSPSGRAEAVGWLGDKCGHDRARAASMVEHEQQIDDYLHERKVERERTVRTPMRDERLTRPEPERVRDRGIERDGHDHDFGLSR
jgi:hypothetical protein